MQGGRVIWEQWNLGMSRSTEIKAELIRAQPTVSGLMGLTLLGTSVMPLNIWQVALYSERRKAELKKSQSRMWPILVMIFRLLLTLLFHKLFSSLVPSLATCITHDHQVYISTVQIRQLRHQNSLGLLQIQDLLSSSEQ